MQEHYLFTVLECFMNQNTSRSSLTSDVKIEFLFSSNKSIIVRINQMIRLFLTNRKRDNIKGINIYGEKVLQKEG